MVNFNSLNTILSDIHNTIRASYITESDPISRRRLEDWIHQYRSLLLKRDLDKGKKPNPDYIQEISAIGLEKVDRTGSDNILDSEEDIWRTNIDIPQTIDLNWKHGFTFVGNTLDQEIQFVPEIRSRWQSYRPYTGQDQIAYLKGRRIYIENAEGLQYIRIRGIFEIPTELINIVNPINNQRCYSYDDKYPIPNNLLPSIKELIFKNELGLELKINEDTTNDSKHNPGE